MMMKKETKKEKETVSQTVNPSNESKADRTGTNPGVIKRFEMGVDRVYEIVDAFYHKYHIVVDVVFLAAFVIFISTALLVDGVAEVRRVLNYKAIRETVLILDKYILPSLAGLALLFDLKDKRLRLASFFSLFLLLLYQAQFENQIISIIPHTNTHFFGAACLVVAAAGQKWKRIGWTYVITCSSLMVLVTVLSLVGVVPDLVFSPELGGRHALGIQYPLNWAAHWFSIALVYCMLKRGMMHFVDYVVLVILLLVSFFVCRARTSSVLCLMLILVTGIRQFLYNNQKIVLFERIRNWKHYDKLFRLAVFSFWIMATVMIILTISYVPPVSTFLDHVPGIGTLCSRLRMGREGLMQWFPSKFGVAYPVHTWIGTKYPDNYFFIDCSYIMILLRSGVIVFGIMMIDLLWVPYRLLHSKNRYSLVILALFAVICAMEHHILDLSFDPFLLISFSMVGTHTASETLVDLLKSIQHRFKRGAVPEKEE